jgi:hypothetical protein
MQQRLCTQSLGKLFNLQAKIAVLNYIQYLGYMNVMEVLKLFNLLIITTSSLLRLSSSIHSFVS